MNEVMSCLVFYRRFRGAAVYLLMKLMPSRESLALFTESTRKCLGQDDYTYYFEFILMVNMKSKYTLIAELLTFMSRVWKTEL